MKITTAGLLIVAALQQGFALPVRAQEQTPVMSELPLSWLSSELEESVQSADIASGKPWLALGTRTGRVSVVDAIAGEVIGLVTGQGCRKSAGRREQRVVNRRCSSLRCGRL